MPFARAIGPTAVGIAVLFAALFAVPVPAALVVVGLIIVGHAAGLLLRGARPAAAWSRPVAAGLAFCGLSTISAGLALGLAPGAMLSDVPLPAKLPLIGLFFVTGMFLIGLFHLPGPAATYTGRLRRLLDGVGIGIWAFFIAWLLVFEASGLKGAGLTAVLVASVALSASTVAALRAAAVQRAALVCGLGVLVTLAAQTALILLLDYHRPVGWLLLAGVPLLVGPALAARAMPVGAPVEPASVASPDGSFGRYPLLALPMAGALVAAAYHLVVVGRFDMPSAVLAIIGVVIVAVREALSVADVRQYARRLGEREERFRSLVVGSSDATMMLDDALVVRWQSPAAARQLGLSDQDVVGRPLLDRVHPDETAVVSAALGESAVLIEARLRDGFGAWRETEWSVSDQRSVGSVRAVVVHIRDISRRRELEHALHRAASSDQLTGLANRTELRRLLAARTERSVLVVLGLDGLSSVNQLRGHEAGDAVLVEAARRLRSAMNTGDVAARLDGDQFAVLTGGGTVQAQMTASRLLTVLSDPYRVIGGAESHLSVSAGLAEHTPEHPPGPTPGVSSDESISRAELALQRARRLGPAQPPQWYDEATATLLRRRLTIEQDLPGALARGEFDLLFQPIVELPSGRCVGVEARPRWRRAGLGAVPPEEFLPIADQLGLHVPLGEWQLAAAFRQLGQWAVPGRQLWLAMSVSPALLASPVLVDLIAASGIPASRLVVQFTVAGSLPRELVERLAALRTLGARTALDRFGTQAGSLSLLRRLPLDLVKLDRGGFTDADDAVVTAVVHLAQQLGVDVAVDGVHTEDDLRATADAGCRLAQGELFCGPAVPERFEAYLDSHRSSTA